MHAKGLRLFTFVRMQECAKLCMHLDVLIYMHVKSTCIFLHAFSRSFTYMFQKFAMPRIANGGTKNGNSMVSSSPFRRLKKTEMDSGEKVGKNWSKINNFIKIDNQSIKIKLITN